MKVPRACWHQLISIGVVAASALLLADASAARAATIECVAQMRGGEVMETLTRAAAYGIRFVPAALNKIEPEREYCRSALLRGAIDDATPVVVEKFLTGAPLLQRLYLSAYGSNVDSGVAAGRLIRARNLTTVAPLAVDRAGSQGVVLAQQDVTKLHDLCTSTSACSCRGVCVALWASGISRLGNVLSFDAVGDTALKAFVKEGGISDPLIAELENTTQGAPLDVLSVRANRNPFAIADGISGLCGVEPTQLNQGLSGNLVQLRNDIRRKDAAWRTCRSAVLVTLAVSASPLLRP